MSPTEGNDASLLGALRDFNQYWDRTAVVWRDAARAGFEKEYLHDLVESIRSAASTISQIELLLGQIRRECS